MNETVKVMCPNPQHGMAIAIWFCESCGVSLSKPPGIVATHLAPGARERIVAEALEKMHEASNASDDILARASWFIRFAAGIEVPSSHGKRLFQNAAGLADEIDAVRAAALKGQVGT